MRPLTLRPFRSDSILSPQLLVTVRFSEVHAFAQVEARIEKDPHVGSAGPRSVALMEGMVDFSADKLEKLSSDLAAVLGTVLPSQDISAAWRQTHFARVT